MQSIDIPMAFNIEMDMLILKFIWNIQQMPNSLINVEKTKDKARLTLPNVIVTTKLKEIKTQNTVVLV